MSQTVDRTAIRHLPALGLSVQVASADMVCVIRAGKRESMSMRDVERAADQEDIVLAAAYGDIERAARDLLGLPSRSEIRRRAQEAEHRALVDRIAAAGADGDIAASAYKNEANVWWVAALSVGGHPMPWHFIRAADEGGTHNNQLQAQREADGRRERFLALAPHQRAYVVRQALDRADA